MNYGFIIDNRRCIGCHACTVACKAEHDTPLGVNRTWVKYVESGEFPQTRRVFSVHRCNHCADAPCVTICPVRSLFVRPDGIVDFDRERCIGCKACMQACPYDALHIDPDTHTSSKCNYCAHRIDRGLEPACVIVCPVHAIISGDLDDSQSEIARTLHAVGGAADNSRRVAVRKPEKKTRPKLFYIDGDPAALRPELAPPSGSYVQGAQAAGVGHFAGHTPGERAGGRTPLPTAPPTAPPPAEAAKRAPRAARRTYDIPQRGVLWDWEVSGYLWTKSIAAGVLFVPLLLHLGGLMPLRPRLQLGLALTSLLFLGLTGALLVKDLDRPLRFAYVLLRPQWRSWLVRGAYLITALGALTTLWVPLALAGRGGSPWLLWPLVALAIPSAVYTAFLLAQARGRDLWQSRLLPLRMLLTSAMTGAAALVLANLLGDMGLPAAPLAALQLALVAHLALLALEFAMPGHTRDTTVALGLIARGPLRVPFWCAVVLGHALPLALLWVASSGLLVLPACILVLLFALVGEHVWVRAPQLIPLS